MIARVCLMLLTLFALVGCGSKSYGPVERSWGRMEGLEQVVGNMDDVSYSTGREQEPRTSAADTPVLLSDFEGSFVWSEYAALWCPTCKKQTPQTKQVAKELGDEIVFLTVMTAKSTKYDDYATPATAKLWARQFGLAPERVIAADLWAKTIPEHRFFSPEGHTLFVHVGYLSADQIRQVIAFYKGDWEAWKANGTAAEWMTSE